MPTDQPIRHGRASSYTKRGCHCPECTEAQRAAVADYRARRRAAGGQRLGRNGRKKAGEWVWSRSRPRSI